MSGGDTRPPPPLHMQPGPAPPGPAPSGLAPTGHTSTGPVLPPPPPPPLPAGLGAGAAAGSAEAQYVAAQAAANRVVKRRAPVACRRCRRMRSKCVHTGAQPPCEGCRAAGLSADECVFPPRGIPDLDREYRHPRMRGDKARKESGQHQRGSGSGNGSGNSHGLASPHTRSGSASLSVGDLPAQPGLLGLPADLWDLLPPLDQVVDGVHMFTHQYFQLGFLPRQTFVQQLRAQPRSVSVFLLLGILSVSARFATNTHTHTGNGNGASSPSPPERAERYMERAAAVALLELNQEPTLARCQGFYLLSLAQQGSGYRNRSFVNLGVALRMAILMRLHREETYEVAAAATTTTTTTTTPTPALAQKAEAARRTLWMLYSQDNLHAGPHSPVALAAGDITTLLPCDEAAFDAGQAVPPAVRAALEDTPPARAAPWRVTAPSRSLFATLMQSHHLWGVVLRRAVAPAAGVDGGAGAAGSDDPDPPGEYHLIRQRLADWEAHLPAAHTWSLAQLRASKAASCDLAYVAVTMVTRLCNIVIRKAYMPSILRAPAHPFWRTMSRELFTNVHELFVQIDVWYGERGPGDGMGAPLAMFCVYSCALMATYLCKYPSLCPDTTITRQGPLMLERTRDILAQGTRVWPLARRWLQSIEALAAAPATAQPSGHQGPGGMGIIEGGMDEGKDPIPSALHPSLPYTAGPSLTPFEDRRHRARQRGGGGGGSPAPATPAMPADALLKLPAIAQAQAQSPPSPASVSPAQAPTQAPLPPPPHHNHLDLLVQASSFDAQHPQQQHHPHPHPHQHAFAQPHNMHILPDHHQATTTTTTSTDPAQLVPPISVLGGLGGMGALGTPDGVTSGVSTTLYDLATAPPPGLLSPGLLPAMPANDGYLRQLELMLQGGELAANPLTTSSIPPERLPSPRASALEAGSTQRPRTPPDHPSSPALSTASTADSAGPSPVLLALPAPRLPERVRALLPPPIDEDDEDDVNDGVSDDSFSDLDADPEDADRFVTASWGSPYRQSDAPHLRDDRDASSQSSDLSEDLPLHHLEIHTPFLRPAPEEDEFDEQQDFDELDESVEPDESVDPEEDLDAGADEDEEDHSSLYDEPLTSPLHTGAPTSTLVTAAILAKRARRPARRLTEDWIRQHTTGDFGSEARLWLSDSSDKDDEQEQENRDVQRTPRAKPADAPHGRHHIRNPPSSIETLRESDFRRLNQRPPASAADSVKTATTAKTGNTTSVVTDAMMASPPPSPGPAAGTGPAAVAASEPATEPVTTELVTTSTTIADAPVLPPPQAPASAPAPASAENDARAEKPLPPLRKPDPGLASHGASASMGGDVGVDPLGDLAVSTLATASPKKTPRRVKKKLPWKGKNILVLLPVDDQRGRPGKPPMPLDQETMATMLRSWEELGYDVNGFDLDLSAAPDVANDTPLPSRSMSRPTWPDEQDVVQERATKKYPVVLPDLNAWKNYVDELNEAKLRALGVSFGDDEPAAPTTAPTSVVGANMSRQSSVNAYPPLPFSPPIPTSSANSSHTAAGGFAFPAAFAPITTQSPSASPIPYNVGSRFNARQSISVPPGSSVFQLPPDASAFSPQALLLHQGVARGASPFSSGMSPTSPFTPDGAFTPPLHQRHQSMQYPPLMQYAQRQTAAARASPRLQDLREIDEEPAMPPHTAAVPVQQARPASNPASFVQQHNTSASFQKEIDDAEYHLEEQFRSQIEHDRGYSPNGEREAADALDSGAKSSQQHQHAHARGLSVQFAPSLPIQRFRDDVDSGPTLHHPRPHSRGHSLANAYYEPNGEAANSAGSGSNGTPLAAVKDVQEPEGQRPFSTASNPWSEANNSFTGAKPTNGNGTRRSSHASKPSLSSLNVDAPEFKFNPAKATAFQPTFGGNGSFFFGGGSANGAAAPPLAIPADAFQPAVFAAGGLGGFSPILPVSADSTQLSFGSTSKINVTAPAFSPGQTEFGFSASGPKFRPDAPAFNPTAHSFSNSLASPIQSATESVGNRPGSIFGSIDLNASELTKPPRRSKAVAIVRPASSRRSPQPSETVAATGEDQESAQYDQEGRFTDKARMSKKARAGGKDDGNGEALFATPTPEPEPVAEVAATEEPAEKPEEEATPVVAPAEADKAPAYEDDSALAAEDSMNTSTLLSGSTDAAKVTTTTSPSEGSLPWKPFEFRSDQDMAAFDSVRPMGDGNSFSFGHKTSLSATAKPFTPNTSFQESLAEDEEVLPTTEVADADVRSASPPPPPPPPATEKPKAKKGLAASRFARASPPPPAPAAAADLSSTAREATSSPPPVPRKDDVVEEDEAVAPAAPLTEAEPKAAAPGAGHEPTFEEIDDIMCQLENDPTQGVNKLGQAPVWEQAQPEPTPEMAAEKAAVAEEEEEEDAFADQPLGAEQSFDADFSFGHRDRQAATAASGGSLPPSEWEGDFAGEEQLKLESRVNFFDGHVNEIVGGILAARLDPLEKSLDRIQHALSSLSRGTSGSRRRGHRHRSNSMGEVQESDADDEDDELPSGPPALRTRSGSPRKDRRAEQMRAAVLEALAAQQHQQTSASPSDETTAVTTVVLKSLADIKEHMEDHSKEEALQARIAELEGRLRSEETKTETEVTTRRAAEDQAAELRRKLEQAETKVEIDAMNRFAFDQRVADLESRLREQEARVSAELAERRAAEDRVVEVQRLLNVSMEEETRLRAQMATAETDLRERTLEVQHWRAEAESAMEASQRHSDDLAQTSTELKHVRRVMDTLGTQLEENERLRDTWRSKFVALQEDMARAARDVAEESAHRMQQEKALVARQEVLEARLQAEARTRERLEAELARLEGGERQALHAVAECTRLNGVVGELRAENHRLQQSTARAQAEFAEARESGAREVQRTRDAMQADVDAANHQVNVVRGALEDQEARLRGQLDAVRLEADTARARLEMLLEEAETTKQTALAAAEHRHAALIEDVEARYARKLEQATEDGQRAEASLVERLSLSSARAEQLQERVAHLEEKLEIARAAAAAAAAKAMGERTERTERTAEKTTSLGLPERISPQALRETIAALQEQLQQQQERNDELQSQLDQVDPDADAKISKRDDEIIWLRELLAVRHADLKDIITALSRDDHDPARVRDAVIRLQANLQMEEQERERAMNGGSAVKLPALAPLAASLRDAATPRVAQAVGPLAAAWGNWRKARDSNASMAGALSGVLSPGAGTPTPAPASASIPASKRAAAAAGTPSRARVASSVSVSSRASGRASVSSSRTARATHGDSSFLSGLMTPPTSGLRQTPPTRQPPPQQFGRAPALATTTTTTTVAGSGGGDAADADHTDDQDDDDDEQPQPTAFASTGRRFTNPKMGGHGRGGAMQAPMQLARPVTPPMVRTSGYDSDANAEEFDDAGFFDE